MTYEGKFSSIQLGEPLSTKAHVTKNASEF